VDLIEITIRLMQEAPSDENVQKEGCRKIGELIQDGVELNKTGCFVIVNALQLSQVVRRAALKTLGKLTMVAHHNRVLGKAGCHAVLDVLTKEEDEACLTYGVWTIANFGHNKVTRYHLGSSGRVIVTRAMEKFPENTDIAKFGCEAIINLASIFENTDHYESMRQLAERVERKFNEYDVRVMACKAIRSLPRRRE
jgi:hypothetical protein